MKDKYDVLEKTLIIAPKSVAQLTWPSELEKWEHTKGLTYTTVLGSEKKRLEALEKDVDLYIINRENIPWLVNHYKTRWPFEILVIDELSSFKNPSAKRFKALKKILYRTERVIGLTGTPAPNNLLDLWSQIFLLDQGKRLERYVTHYKERYFYPAYGSGHIVYKWELKDGSEDAIYRKIDDIAISMKAKDYLDLPKRTDNIIEVHLPKKAMREYDELEKELLLEYDEGQDVVALNSAALAGKLMQMANGTVYDEDKNEIEVHSAKLDELDRIIEDSQGEPVLVFYHYKHDLKRLRARFKDAEVMNIEDDTAARWNRGEIPILLAHPQSAGHGLNLQAGGHIIVWYSMTWALELYQQANARLDRQGQTKPVIVHHLVAKDTVDELAMAALARKEAGQDALMQALKARSKELKGE